MSAILVGGDLGAAVAAEERRDVGGRVFARQRRPRAHRPVRAPVELLGAVDQLAEPPGLADLRAAGGEQRGQTRNHVTPLHRALR